MNGSGLAMFRRDQLVRVVRSTEEGVNNRTGRVVEIQNDGSALIRFDGKREPRQALCWPDECEPA